VLPPWHVHGPRGLVLLVSLMRILASGPNRRRILR
jgi:hypothetical protein